MTNPPRPSKLLAAYTATLFLTACAGRLLPRPPNAPPPAATVAAPATVPSEEAPGTEFFRELLRREPLQFATDDPRTPERFHFFVHVKQPAADGQPHVTRILVVRDGAHVALLCTSRDGLPYAYMARDLLVMVDRANPGGLVLYPRGSPTFVLAANEAAGRLDFELEYRGGAARPSLTLDLASLLRATLAKLRSASFDPTRRTISARTENSLVVIQLPEERLLDAPPLTGFMTSNPTTGASLSVVSLAVGEPLPIDPAALDAADVLRSGMPVRHLTAAEARTGIDLLAPPQFGADPREKRVAIALRRLVSMAQEQPPGRRRRIPPAPVQQVQWQG